MGSPRIFDITPVISERIGVFPGDVSFRREISLDFKKGDNLLLSAIHTTLHVGAHADGPNHYKKTGEGIGTRDPKIYFGRCLVLHASLQRGDRVSRSHLSEKYRLRGSFASAERILVKTGSFPNPDSWNSDFNSFEPSLIEDMANEGAKLIGIDTPSIDPESSKDLPSHAMVAKYDLAILEGIVLEGVPEGFLYADGASAKNRKRRRGSSESRARRRRRKCVSVINRDAEIFETKALCAGRVEKPELSL